MPREGGPDRPDGRGDDALARLDRSHRRHDEAMRALVDAATRLADGQGDGRDVDTVADVLAFLDRATPRHFADEEEAAFPRIAARDPELGATCASIAAEHRDHEARHRRLFDLFDRWGDAMPPAADARDLRDEVTALAAVYRDHVAREDELFARVRPLLDADDHAAIVATMEARRGRGGGGGGGGGRR